MGLGPSEPVRNALKYASVSISNIDLFEIKRRSPCRSSGLPTQLGIDHDKFNISPAVRPPWATRSARPVPASPRLCSITSPSQTRLSGSRPHVSAVGRGFAMVVERLSRFLPAPAQLGAAPTLRHIFTSRFPPRVGLGFRGRAHRKAPCDHAPAMNSYTSPMFGRS